MKRSEALRIIADNHAPGYDYDENEAAEETLKKLEQAGMLPPGYHTQNQTEHGYTYDKGFYNPGWEPEDDG